VRIACEIAHKLNSRFTELVMHLLLDKLVFSCNSGQSGHIGHTVTAKRRTLGEVWIRNSCNAGILGVPALLIFFALPGSAASGCQQTPSDSTFAPDGSSAPQFETGLTPTSTRGTVPPLYQTRTWTINRVVGPGTATEFDTSGFLVNWATYVQNGVLSKTAYLQLELVGLIEHANPNFVGIYLNDHLVKSLRWLDLYGATSAGVGRDCIQIETTQFIKFARRVPGQAPIPGVNTIGISIDTPQNEIIGQSGNATVGTLTFRAMAPIIMVHGCCGEDGGWFNTTQPQQNYLNQSFAAFVSPFDFGRYPYDFSVDLRPESNTQDDGETLLDQLHQKAAEFGANHLHIVAHSKGGLNSRYALQVLNAQARLQPASLGVYSLTTLSTPHKGSANADYYVDSQFAPLTGNSNNLRVAAAKARRLGPADGSIADLRVSSVLAFNQGETQRPLPTSFKVNGVKNGVKYYAVSADASESSSSHQLSTADILAMPVIVSGTSPTVAQVNLALYQQVYQLMGEVTSTQFLQGSGTVVEHTSAFQPNDLAVTRASANYTSPSTPPVAFEEIVFLQGQNHSSESNSLNGVALTIVQKIRSAQPLN
jgi:hypothetical protein